MVTSKASKTKLDPKLFNFESVMLRTKAPNPEPVSVFLRPDLVPRILELQELLENPPKDDDSERAIGDVPAGGNVEELEVELDQLEAEFNDSELVFEFRPSKLSDQTNARAAMVADKYDLADDETGEVAISYMLAQTCVNAGWTGAEFHKWREAIGEAAFRPLFNAAQAANAGPAVSVPFSRRPLRGLTSGK